MCLAGHRKKVHVSPLLQSSSYYVWQATKQTCNYHHFYGVPLSTTGRSPKGSLRITTPAEFLTICLASHQKDVYYHHSYGVPQNTTGRPPNGSVRYHLRSSSQRARYATKRMCTCCHFWRSPHSVRGRAPNGSYAVRVSQQENVCPLTTAGEGDLLKIRRGGDPDGILFRVR